MNGLLVVDKPRGMTSHDVVHRVRRATGESSIGHLGTLDPMATGVLPLLLGRFTRLAQFFKSDEKSYTGVIRFGFATDTYDAEGEVASAVVEPKLSLEEIRGAALGFRGEMQQMPPAFSAKKINGVPAHKLARAGKEVVLKPARIVIHRFEIVSATSETAEFEIEVSAGGYVRSVAHEMGEVLGCGAHLTQLRRVKAGDFALEQALALDAIERLGAAGELEPRLPHPRSLLPEMPAVTADAMTAGRIRNGAMVNLPEYSGARLIRIFSSQRDLMAIGKRIAGTLFQPMVVIG